MLCANRYDRNSLTRYARPDSGRGMLVVIDPSVADYQMLAAGVLPGAETIVLEPNRDAIGQITMALTRHREYQSLHIVCHGAPGKLYLGKTSLSAKNLAPYRQQLLEWGVGEILLYGCEVAAGNVGTAFVEQLSRLTGADIAASDRRVGNAALGGSWHLESYCGDVSAGLAFVPDVVREYKGVFAIQFSTRNTYLVNEADGTFVGDPVTVIRTGTTPNATVDVVFGTPPHDSATGGPILIPGVDYVNTTHTVTFAAGQTSAVVPLQINQDGITEGTEAFGLTLRNATGPEDIHPFDFSNVNILEGGGGTTIPGLPGLPNLPGLPGLPGLPDLSSFNLVGFTIANYQVNEDGTAVGVPVTIERAGLTNLPSSIDVQLIDGTATGGVDFDNTTIPITFAANQTTATVTVPITDDADIEGTENLTLQLVNGSSGTVLGLQNTATLEILDDDNSPPPLPVDPENGVEYKPGEILVKFKSDVTDAQIQTVAQAYGAIAVESLVPSDPNSNSPLEQWQVLKFAPNTDMLQVRADLGQEASVEAIELNYLMSVAAVPNDSDFGQLWGLDNTGQNGGTPDADIDAPEAWECQKGSHDVVVAVIDTGVDYNHEDLAANIWTNSGEIPNNGLDDDGNGFEDDLRGWDFGSASSANKYKGDNDPRDEDKDGHGTHVAGIIGAVGGNGIGVVGVSHDVSLMPLKVTNDRGQVFSGSVAQAIQYAVENEADVINASLDSQIVSDLFLDALSYVEQTNTHDVLVVAPAGNKTSDNDRYRVYPANYNEIYPNVISVAATDNNDQLAGFSNYGATTVDIAAPGVNIRSTLPGNNYGSKDGTSMAAAYVSGAAALLLAQDPSLNPTDLKNILRTSADKKSSLRGKTVSEGRLNLYNSLESLNNPPVVNNPIFAQSGNVGYSHTGTTFTFVPNSYTDPDSNDSITYSIAVANTMPQYTWESAVNRRRYRKPKAGVNFPEIPLPSWLTFDPITRTINIDADTRPSRFKYAMKITATDKYGATASEFVWFKSYSHRGFIIDGYIAGSTVFLDANNNGVLDAGEPSAITDNTGEYALDVDLNTFDTNGNGQIDPDEGSLVAVGGTDTATDLPLETPLTATPDATTVTLLTSLVADLVEDGFTVEEANAKVTTALSIPSSVPLNHLDPIITTRNNDPGGVETFTAMVQTQNFITQTMSLISGVSDSSNGEIVKEVVAAINSQIKADVTLDLTDPTLLETIVLDVATRTGVDLSGSISEAVQIMAEANQRISNIAATTPTDSIEIEFAKEQKISLGEESTYLKELAAGIEPIGGIVSFDDVKNSEAGNFPVAVALGDFDRDSILDAVTANTFGNNVSVLLGDGTGEFAPPINFDVGRFPSAVAVGDFDKDDNLDLAVTSTIENNVSVLLGDGTGEFAPPTNFDVGTAPAAIVVEDLDADGDLDIGTANSSSNNVSVLLGNGSGGFDPANNFAVGTSSFSFPSAVAAGDFNGDDHLDLITANRGASEVSILSGDGNGNFNNVANFGVGSFPTSVVLDDFNADGKLDIVSANSSSNDISVLLGDGSGGISTTTNFEAGTDPRSLGVGDFDLDKIPDLAVANGFSNEVSVLLADGTGGFGAPTSVAVGNGPRFLSVGDLNGDSKADVVTANNSSNDVSVLLNDESGLMITMMPPRELVLNDLNIKTGQFTVTSATAYRTAPNGTEFIIDELLTTDDSPIFFDATIGNGHPHNLFEVHKKTQAINIVGYFDATNPDLNPAEFDVTIVGFDGAGYEYTVYLPKDVDEELVYQITDMETEQVLTDNTDIFVDKVKPKLFLSESEALAEFSNAEESNVGTPNIVVGYGNENSTDSSTLSSSQRRHGTGTSVDPDTGSISGHKWNDLDADGEWDSDEPAIAGWTIYLEEDNVPGLTGSDRSTVTNTDGLYQFAGLNPGEEYIVAEVLDDDAWQTYPDRSNPNRNGTNTYSKVMVNRGQPVFKKDFGNHFNNPPEVNVPLSLTKDVVRNISSGPGIAAFSDPDLNLTPPLDEELTLKSLITSAPGGVLPSWFNVSILPDGNVTFDGSYPGPFLPFWVQLEVEDSWGATASQPPFFVYDFGGIFIDAYIAGGTVFFDANKNGILDDNEPFTHTDENGVYDLEIPTAFDTNSNGQFDPEEGSIVGFGGIDTGTGLELATPVTATPDAAVLTLLTTLVADLADQGLTVQEANEKVTTALSLPSEVNLNQVDPILATNTNFPGGVETFAAMVQVQNVITQTMELISGASDASNGEIVKEIVAAITAQIQANVILDFSDAALLETIIIDAATGVGVELSPIVSQAADVMAEVNQRIEDIVAITPTESLETEFAKVQKTALDAIASDLKEAAAGTKTIADLVAENTGAALDNQIANVQVYSAAPTDLELSGATVAENRPIGTEVGIFSTIDPDAGETHSYSLVPGEGDTDNDSFEIVGNSLRTSETFDYETQDAYNIRVQTTDGNGGVYWEQFTINVSDAEETPPGNEITGGTGGSRDVLTGTDGDDIITGLRGRDRLTGGAGSDQFVYTSLRDAGDIITDFEVGSDKIVLGQVLDSLNYSGTDPITDGYISFGTRSDDTIIRLDADGISGPGRARSFILVQDVSVDDLNNPNNFAW